MNTFFGEREATAARAAARAAAQSAAETASAAVSPTEGRTYVYIDGSCWLADATKAEPVASRGDRPDTQIMTTPEGIYTFRLDEKWVAITRDHEGLYEAVVKKQLSSKFTTPQSSSKRDRVTTTSTQKRSGPKSSVKRRMNFKDQVDVKTILKDDDDSSLEVEEVGLQSTRSKSRAVSGSKLLARICKMPKTGHRPAAKQAEEFSTFILNNLDVSAETREANFQTYLIEKANHTRMPPEGKRTYFAELVRRYIKEYHTLLPPSFFSSLLSGLSANRSADLKGFEEKLGYK